MIKISEFKMMFPIIAENKTPLNVAVDAVNCDNESGDLKPLKAPTTIQTLQKSGDIRSIYKCGETWLGFLNRTSFVRAPSENGRVYFTGDGYPKHTDQALCIAGGIPSLYPSTTFRMGASRPEAALAVGLSIYNAEEDYGDILGTVSYCYTYVNYISEDYQEESALSPPTIPVPIRSNEKAVLSSFVKSTEAGVNNVYYRVYRSLNGGDYESVPTGRDVNGDFTFDMHTDYMSFTDIDTETGKIYLNVNILNETNGWDPLPDEAENLCQFQNGILAATYGKKVLLSALFVPYAFPQGDSTSTMDYTYEFPTEPVRIASFRDMLIVGLKSNPYVLMGADPGAMQQQEIPYPQACLGDMCVTEIGVFYPSPDGLVLCDGVVANPVTDKTYSIAQWRALGPENLKLIYFNNRLYGFFKGTSDGFIFDFKGDRSVRRIDLSPDVFWDGHTVPEDDKFYILTSDNGAYQVKEWGASESNLVMSWAARMNNGLVRMPDAFRVVGDYSGDVSLDLSVSVDDVFTDFIAIDDAPFWSGLNCWGEEFRLEVSGTATVKEIRIGGIPSELRNG